MSSNILLYRAEIQVRLEDNTVWLSQAQMAELFGMDRSVITKHVRNIFDDGELREDSVSAIFAHTDGDGKTYRTKHYNLEVIISVGYRVNFAVRVQFRIWNTKRMKDYLAKGFTIKASKPAHKYSCQEYLPAR